MWRKMNKSRVSQPISRACGRLKCKFMIKVERDDDCLLVYMNVEQCFLIQKLEKNHKFS